MLSSERRDVSVLFADISGFTPMSERLDPEAVTDFLVPWLVWNWLIGVTVHVHHIAADIAWHPRERWNRLRAQVDGTSNYRIPRALNLFWHNIFLHAPHHVDPRIPFYRLPRAADALALALGRDESLTPLRFGEYARAARSCKLYDFERGTWVDYAGVVAAPAIASV